MPEPRIINAAQALLEGMDICLERDRNVFLMGEGVADPKGIFGTTLGLLQKYGPDRVIEMPVAENGLTGIAIGAAMTGMRPVMVHQRVDFALLALEQIFNNAAKAHYVSNGRHKVPLVIRMIIGRGWGQGPAHSQSLETLFAYMPGLKVVMPTTAYDSKGMLIAAVEDDNPVVILEHRWFHFVTGAVPAGYYTAPLDGPRKVRSGGDVTLVANSYMLYEAMRAADALESAGIGVDLFDLRVLRPLKLDAILDSVRRTGRLVMADTGFKFLGIGAEVTAAVAESAFSSLKAAPIRVGLPDHPTPSSRVLAAEFYPSALDLVEAVRQVCSLPAERLTGVVAQIREIMDRLPVDVPDPAFRGPF